LISLIIKSPVIKATTDAHDAHYAMTIWMNPDSDAADALRRAAFLMLEMEVRLAGCDPSEFHQNTLIR
jgi:hypothetical protein